MLALVLLAIQCHGLVEDSRFKVIKCSTDDGQPELTFTIDKEYFEQNLLWQADQEYFKDQDTPDQRAMIRWSDHRTISI